MKRRISDVLETYDLIFSSRQIMRQETYDLYSNAFWKYYDILSLYYPSKVIDILKKHVKDHPLNEDAFNLIIFYYKNNDKDMWLKYSRTYFNKNPNSPLALECLLESLINNGKEIEAFKLTEQIGDRANSSKNIEMIFSISNFYLDYYQNYKKARKFLNISKNCFDEKPKKYWYLTAKLEWITSPDRSLYQCLELIDKALEIDEYYYEALILKGEILFKSGRVLKSRQIYEIALKNNQEKNELLRILQEINDHIEELKEQEKLMYSFLNNISAENNLDPLTLEIFSNNMLNTNDHIGNQKIIDYSRMGLPNIHELSILLKKEMYTEALNSIDGELLNNGFNVKLNWMKGFIFLMKGDYKSAQKIDDEFWKTTPTNLLDEILINDFAGIFVNIVDEIDYYNRKSNERGINRRFSLNDMERVKGGAPFIEDAIKFLMCTNDGAFLENIKPVIRKEELVVFNPVKRIINRKIRQ